MARVIITDVTRMGVPRVCIAGLSESTPVRLNAPSPDDSLISRLGGLLPGDVVEVALRRIKTVEKPHIEDCSWSELEKKSRMAYAAFVKLLRENEFVRVEDAFGEPFRETNAGNCAFRPGSGNRSLASLYSDSLTVFADDEGKLRVNLFDAQHSWPAVPLESLSIRTHDPISCTRCGADFIRTLNEELSGPAVLRIGLGRPFRPRSYGESGCWLQVNGIFLLLRKSFHFM